MRVLLICNYKPGVGGISGQVELLQKHLREDGHIADIFSTKGPIFWRLGLLWWLRKVARDYDVLHIHCCSGWGFLPAVVGVTVGRWSQKRIVLTYHGGGGEIFFDKHRCLVRHYLNHTDANIVLSGFLARVFDKCEIPCTVIPNIIELDETVYRKREELTPKFVCTRTHEPLYNIPCILRAFSHVQRELPDAKLTLIGDGPQHDELVEFAKKLSLRNVVFTGQIPNDEIYDYLDHADILLSTPHIDNMPVSLLEAMNAGLLVISSRVGGVPYMVEEGKTGLLFEDDKESELSEKMLWALYNQKESKNIIRQAHLTVANYRWDSIKKRIYFAYGMGA